MANFAVTKAAARGSSARQSPPKTAHDRPNPCSNDMQTEHNGTIGGDERPYWPVPIRRSVLNPESKFSRMKRVESMSGEPVTALSEEESWGRLAGVSLGRLVTNVADRLEIFPVNFVVQGRTVVFRTAEGTKLFAAVANSPVAFEADDHNVAEGWSVIVRGRAEVLKTESEIEEAERAQLLPWTATLKLHYVRVISSEITGRHFRFGPEPDSYFTSFT
jgi:uncharacterized protein